MPIPIASLSSIPCCPERCPTCKSSCWGGRTGHVTRLACGARVTPELHQCLKGHVWGTVSGMREVLRETEREARREVIESLDCHKCIEIVKRLGIGSVIAISTVKLCGG